MIIKHQNREVLQCDLCEIARVWLPVATITTIQSDFDTIAQGWQLVEVRGAPMSICPTCQTVARALQIANQKADEIESAKAMARAAGLSSRCPTAVWDGEKNVPCMLRPGHGGAHAYSNGFGVNFGLPVQTHQFIKGTGTSALCTQCGLGREAHAS
jgi:hypothetical protein